MTTLNTHEILERAGADPNAPEGSQAWALAQVDEAVSELAKVAKEASALLMRVRTGDDFEVAAWECADRINVALVSIGVHE